MFLAKTKIKFRIQHRYDVTAQYFWRFTFVLFLVNSFIALNTLGYANLISLIITNKMCGYGYTNILSQQLYYCIYTNDISYAPIK